MDSGSCLQTYFLHSEAVRAARWSPCGRRILSGGFDFALHLTDLETGVFLGIVTPGSPPSELAVATACSLGTLLRAPQPPAVGGFRAGGAGAGSARAR